MEFRLLTASEIECRISTCNQYGVGLLLYKDARCDQNILDETVGAMNWQRHHSRDNANCIVSIWDENKRRWIQKEDTGTESNTEKEKGLASDSFKRACFNWGIGRELYTAPQMFVNAKDLKTLESSDWNGKKVWKCKDFFTVEEIEYVDRKIVYVKVKNNKNNVEIEFGTPADGIAKEKEVLASKIDKAKLNVLVAEMKKKGIAEAKILERYKIDSLEDMTFEMWQKAMKGLEATPEV